MLKMRKMKIILSIIILSIFCLIGNISNAKDKREDMVKAEVKMKEKAIIEVKYVPNKETNTVIVRVISNIELKQTKKTWKISENQKEYEFEFNRNTKYITNFVDMYENIIPVEINVKDVDESPAEIKVKYEPNKEKNTVIAKVISNRELQQTKKTWKISEDKKEYEFEFNRNTKYITNFIDMYENTIPVEINIKDVDESPAEIEVRYEPNEEKNTITARIISNIELQPTKKSWKLSENQKEYIFEFNGNTKYITNFVDMYGNIIPVEINIYQINETKMETKYKYIESSNTVLVTVTSNNGFKPTKASWKINEDQTQYTFEFNDNTKYTTNFVDKYGKVIPVEIEVTQVRIRTEIGTYGKSGAKIHGVNGGSDLEYIKVGEGPNVLFATFCVHGYEDSWSRDGGVLVDIANNFYNRLINDNDINLGKKWTIYILKEVNPDGRRLGTTQNGPGRTTLYSKLGKGMDINRCWQVGDTYKRYTDSRNYNGTEGFQAYEAEALRDFILSHRTYNGKNILVDLHGWENQLIGDESVCTYYKQQYTSCATRNYGKYGTQYIITWAKQMLGADVALVELPKANNYDEVNRMGLSNKYINATLNMLRNYNCNVNRMYKKSIQNVDTYSDFEVAFSGMIKKSKPSTEDIKTIVEKYCPTRSGIWINENSRESILKYLNDNLNCMYNINEDGYLEIKEKYNQAENDRKIESLINGDKLYIFDISSICYMNDPITRNIVDNPYNDFEKYQTYEYYEDENRMIIFISENAENELTNNEIIDSITNLID